MTDFKVKYSSAREEKAFLTNRLIDMYTNIALTRFKWTGLDTIGLDALYIEKILFEQGRIGIFNDPTLSFISLPVAQKRLKYNGAFYSWYPTGDVTGTVKIRSYSEKDSVLILNNKLMQSNRPLVAYWCNKMSDAELTSSVERMRIRLNAMLKIAGSNKTGASLKAALQKLFDGETAIIADETVTDALMAEMPGQVGNCLADIADDYNRYDAKILTYLGINNVNVDKRERLVTDEAQGNNAEINANLAIGLACRQAACLAFKKVFGLDISVSVNPLLAPSTEPSEPENGEEVEDNE